MHAFLITLSLALAQTGPGPDNQPPPHHPVPFYLPRTVSLGVMVINAVQPHVRVGWELTVVEQPRNDLVLLLHVGSGLGVAAMADGMTALYQHVLVAGIGYRQNREKWQWGFDIGVGPLWYRAAYLPETHKSFESRVQGYTEGAVRAGARIKGNLFVGGFVGLGTTWQVLYQFPGAAYTGGLRLGAYVDWR